MRIGIKRTLPWLIAAILFVAMVRKYPPGAVGVFTWTRWWFEPSAVSTKAIFLLKTYLQPALLSFAWIMGFQFQMRTAPGTRVSWIFAVVFASSVCMMTAWRTLAAGPSMLPGYAVGIEAAQTLASRVHAVTRPQRTLFGKTFRSINVIWRGQLHR